MLTDKEIIQKIQSLRTIQPNQDWVVSLHNQILQEAKMHEDSRHSLRVPFSYAMFTRIFRPAHLIMNEVRLLRRPVPLFAAAGVLVIILVVAAGGFLTRPGSDTGVIAVHPPQSNESEKESVLVSSKDKGGSEVFVSGEDSSKNVDVLAVLPKTPFQGDVQEEEGGQEVRIVIIPEEKDEKFEEEFFDQVVEKLEKVEQMVSEISSLADIRETKDLLNQAKASLDEGNLVDAFEILVALERLLER